MQPSISNCLECGEFCLSDAAFCQRCGAELATVLPLEPEEVSVSLLPGKSAPVKAAPQNEFEAILARAETTDRAVDLETSAAPVSAWRILSDSSLAFDNSPPEAVAPVADPFQDILDAAEFQESTVKELSESDSRDLLESMFGATGVDPSVQWSMSMPTLEDDPGPYSEVSSLRPIPSEATSLTTVVPEPIPQPAPQVPIEVVPTTPSPMPQIMTFEPTEEQSPFSDIGSLIEAINQDEDSQPTEKTKPSGWKSFLSSFGFH